MCSKQSVVVRCDALLSDPVIPGLALPEGFESLERRVDSILQLCKLKGSVESQVMGVVTVCQELQRLLKCAFVGE